MVVAALLAGCAGGSQAVSGDAGDAGSVGDMATVCGVAPGARCCVPFGRPAGDMAGLACAPGLVCEIPDGGQTHYDTGTCEVQP